MALPSSGTMTLAMIAGEFGGSTPHSLSEYYRGGGLVPNIPANSGIPTSGSISFSHFYGGTAQLMGSFNGTVASSYGLDMYGTGSIGGSGFTPTTDSTGKTLAAVFDDYSLGFPNGSYFQIAGFSSDPGIGYFTNLAVGGFSKSSASAGYGYSGGSAFWNWGSNFGFGSGSIVVTYS